LSNHYDHAAELSARQEITSRFRSRQRSSWARRRRLLRPGTRKTARNRPSTGFVVRPSV